VTAPGRACSARPCGRARSGSGVRLDAQHDEPDEERERRLAAAARADDELAEPPRHDDPRQVQRDRVGGDGDETEREADHREHRDDRDHRRQHENQQADADGREDAFAARSTPCASISSTAAFARAWSSNKP
jgi:hypothetical protein